MNDLRRILRNQLRAVVGLAALGGLLHLQVAHADGLADPAFNRFRSQVVGNNVNFSYGGAGTPLAGSGNSTGIGVSSGVDVQRAMSINTKHGPIAGTLTQKVSSAAMGKAIGRAAALLGGPAGLAFLALPAIVEWFSEAGVGSTSGGVLTVEVVNYGYRRSFSHPVRATLLEVCHDFGATPATSGFVRSVIETFPTYDSVSIGCSWPGNPGGNTYGAIRTKSTGVQPGTPQQVEDALTASNPSPEALAELYKLSEFIPSAHPVPDLIDTLRAEFEARSPETVETKSTDSPTETKTEEKRCATYTQLSGSTVGLVEQCETTTTTQPKDPETGEPVGQPKVETSTSTSTALDPATKEETEDPCANSPDRMMCVKLGTVEGEIPTATRSVSYTPEILFGSGTCPPDQTIVVYGMSLKLTDMPKACNLLSTYVKPIAVLLAAFTALMIVAVGVPE